MQSSAIVEKQPFFQPSRDDVMIERVKSNTPNSMLRCHFHTAYEIYYLHSGERYYFIKDKMYHIKKGDLVFISPSIIHASLNVKDRGYERFLITFNKKNISNAAKLFNTVNFLKVFESEHFVIPTSPRDRIVIEDILKRMTDAGNEAAKTLVLLELLHKAGNLKAVSNDNSTELVSAPDKLTADIMAYINNNFLSELTLETVSEKFFISPCYLSRTFKKSTGISFVDYINNVRIMEAKKQLLKTSKSIFEISSDSGFKSNTHFGRVFKEITGMSPMQFRKKG